MYGKFIRSIKVLDVIDSDGRSVFETGAESRTPASLLFAVKKEETHGLSAADMKLLIDAAQNRNIGTLIPVPRNKSYTENPGETEIASTYIYNYILSQVSIVPSDDGNTTVEEENTNE